MFYMYTLGPHWKYLLLLWQINLISEFWIRMLSSHWNQTRSFYVNKNKKNEHTSYTTRIGFFVFDPQLSSRLVSYFESSLEEKYICIHRWRSFCKCWNSIHFNNEDSTHSSGKHKKRNSFETGLPLPYLSQPALGLHVTFESSSENK